MDIATQRLGVPRRLLNVLSHIAIGANAMSVLVKRSRKSQPAGAIIAPQQQHPPVDQTDMLLWLCVRREVGNTVRECNGVTPDLAANIR